MDLVKIFAEYSGEISDENMSIFKSVQKKANKWLKEEEENIRVKSIMPSTMPDSDGDGTFILTIYYTTGNQDLLG